MLITTMLLKFRNDLKFVEKGFNVFNINYFAALTVVFSLIQHSTVYSSPSFRS